MSPHQDHREDQDAATTRRRAVTEIENVWIPMPDGCRLAARLWLPAGAEGAPVPAILEYIPYRKRDFSRLRDEPLHHAFAAQGYASLRVDVRGSGDSDGILVDEYSPQELDDALALLAWIAAQPWCDGAIGMLGKSWGGFNSLQVAARNPPQLRAVISVCASDDRHADDAHYMGGCLLNENLVWGASLLAYATCPPDPEISGPGWRDKWLDRLAQATLFPARWLRHQQKDAYWRRGSVCEDYAAIRCPVFLAGGWADGYTNAVPRLLAGLRVPRKGLIGPWAHTYPHDGVPGPAVDFIAEALRWWDRWLKGRDTGVEADPMLRVWMQEWAPPRPSCAERPGRWVAEAVWPSPRIERRILHLTSHGLAPQCEGDAEVGVRSAIPGGVAAGAWCPFSAQGDLPGEQRGDDAGALAFDTEPLAADTEILGAVTLSLDLAVDRPQAMLAVRLNDVAPDGSSSRVTYGLLNLAQRDGAARALVPGERIRVRVALKQAGYRFAAGHRLRVALSTDYWPLAWPMPHAARLRLWCASSTVELPVRPPSDADAALRPLAAPQTTSASGANATTTRKVEHDLIGDAIRTLSQEDDSHGGPVITRLAAAGLEIGSRTRQQCRIRRSDPLSAEAHVEVDMLLRRTRWSAGVQVEMRMSASQDAFTIEANLRATEAGEEIERRSWHEVIPRGHL